MSAHYKGLRQPGRLNTRLQFEQNIEIDDGCGGYENAWVAVTSLWVHIDPVRTRLDRIAASSEGRITHHIWLRFRDDVSHDYRFRKGGRVFEIINAFDPDETGRYLLCECEERK